MLAADLVSAIRKRIFVNPILTFLDPVMATIETFCQAHQLQRPTVVIEPGRSIVAEAGISLAYYWYDKTLPQIRTYASIDGGMTDNIRPGLYQAEYTGILANRGSRNCHRDSYDFWARLVKANGYLSPKDLQLPKVETGDLFATFATGAYGYSMASNYNKLAIPAVVFC